MKCAAVCYKSFYDICQAMVLIDVLEYTELSDEIIHFPLNTFCFQILHFRKNTHWLFCFMYLINQTYPLSLSLTGLFVLLNHMD